MDRQHGARGGRRVPGQGQLIRRNVENVATCLEIQAVHFEVHVEQIVDPKADVEVLDKDGDPPIMFALVVGTPNLFSALIRRGENVKTKLKKDLGPSVGHVYAFHGQPNSMCELFLFGANPNVADDEGVQHRTIAKKHTDCAIVILENGGCKSMGILNSKKLTYCTDIFRGVVELHATSVSCMNLKSSNLLLDARGRAVVFDFGLLEILKKPQYRKTHSVPKDNMTRMHSCVDYTMLNPHYTYPKAHGSHMFLCEMLS
eukprot:Gb_35568 [translate_table: standard]